jgi:GNAT superfamily N-acetyltransferase
MPTLVRRALLADSDEIAEVFLASRATMTYLPRLHTDDDTRSFIAHVVRDLETFVAVRAERIVGFAALREDWLDHLYVLPERFNTQTGTKLFEEVRFQRPQGVQFWVFQQNAGARRFYERHGCALARLTDGSRNEERLPDALYVWPATRAPSE